MFQSLPYILPFYHVVSDDELPHVKSLFYVKTVSEFISDIEYIGEQYDYVDLDEFYSLSLRSFSGLTKPVVHLSFDDGLRQCYDIIAPILLKKGIPATFFINTAFVDNKRMLFRFKASLINEHLKGSGIHSAVVEEELMKVSYGEEGLLDQFAIDYDLDFQNFLEEEKPYMSWRQIEILQKQGFSLGAHSVDHPLLKDVDSLQATRQVADCFEEIDMRCKLQCKAFAFPFTDDGISVDLFNSFRDNNLFDISFGTAGIKQDVLPMNFQRIPMEWNYSAKKILFFYKLKAAARKYLGVNVIRR
ncbi:MULTISPECIES: polysaccharide deacetylase family protein [unclassified Carboxylicivirga]|uniref:polysaccharide deacetylase family protein n=1 Tax=Carboxylicivirga TaxID=1628153 RepID=UPI003D337ADC